MNAPSERAGAAKAPQTQGSRAHVLAPTRLDSWAVADPSDKAHYLKHQSADELRPLAGGSPAAVSEVSQWLLDLGGSDVKVSALWCLR